MSSILSTSYKFLINKNSFRISYKKIIFRTIRISLVALKFASQRKFAGFFFAIDEFIEAKTRQSPHIVKVKYRTALVNAIFDSSGNCTTHFFFVIQHTQ